MIGEWMIEERHARKGKEREGTRKGKSRASISFFP